MRHSEVGYIYPILVFFRYCSEWERLLERDQVTDQLTVQIGFEAKRWKSLELVARSGSLKGFSDRDNTITQNEIVGVTGALDQGNLCQVLF